MDTVFIVAIVFGSIVTLAGLLCVTVLLAMKMCRTGLSAKERKKSNDEATMIQEIYRGLEKMEDRVEALETILMDGRTTSGDKK